jgi:2-methylcitrate dehydratase PrpD
MNAPLASAGLVALSRRIEVTRLPPDVVRLAKHCVLDWLGVTRAGLREPVVSIVLQQLASADSAGEATLLDDRCPARRTSLLTAALVHGTAAHVLDYDDSNWTLQGHPTAPVLSGLFSLAEREGASGGALLAALVAGIELESRLGSWLNPSHYERGFHATATLGSFGAAAAACHLLGLSELGWLHALGLAASQAAGLKSAFGSMAKPLQVGRAAQTGVMAALLAAGGVTSNPYGLECAQGFAPTHADAALDASVMLAEPDRFYIRMTLFKYHAACHLTHGAIEALLQLAREHGPLAERVAHVRVYVDPICFGVCNIARPSSGMEAKFSLRAVVAMVLLGDDTSDPESFSDARAARPALAAWLDRIEVLGEAQSATRARVLLSLHDGATLSAAVDVGVPNPDLADQGRRLAAKFDRLAGLPPLRARALRDAVDTLEHASSLQPLLELAAG